MTFEKQNGIVTVRDGSRVVLLLTSGVLLIFLEFAIFSTRDVTDLRFWTTLPILILILFVIFGTLWPWTLTIDTQTKQIVYRKRIFFKMREKHFSVPEITEIHLGLLSQEGYSYHLKFFRNSEVFLQFVDFNRHQSLNTFESLRLIFPDAQFKKPWYGRPGVSWN